MSGPGEDAIWTDVEAYLRGEMTTAESAEFERRMVRDTALREAVELERRISDRLRHVCPPAPAGAGRRRSPPTRNWVRIGLGMAAAIALTAAGLYLAGTLSPAPGGTKADAILARLERTGFEPVYVCDDDAKFIEYTREKFGQAFTVAPDAGVQVIGWSYCTGVLSDDAGVMLVTLDGREKAIVLVDREDHDRPVELTPGSGLHVHRRKVGDAVLYEVSPRGQPAVLPLVKAAD